MWIVKLALRLAVHLRGDCKSMGMAAWEQFGRQGAASDGRHPPIQRIVKTRQHFVGGIV